MVRSVALLIAAVVFSCTCAGCAGGGSSGVGSTPTLPAQIPTTVEYAGETIAGDISVETGGTALFTVTDADGNIVDPVLVTAELAEPTASLSVADELLLDASLGAFSVDGDNIVYTANNYLPPNQLGQITAQFSYNGEVLGTSDLKISPSLEDINASKYKFTNVYTTENETVYPEVGYPDVAVDGFGNVYVCFTYEAQGSQGVESKIVLKRGSYSETNSVGITWQANEWTATVANPPANFCNVIVYNGTGTSDSRTAKVALIWEYYAGSRSNGSSELVISSDGGVTFSDPVAISYSVYDADFDQNGKIHMAAIDIDGCPGGPLFGVKYLVYDGSAVTDRGTVNNESACAAGNESKPDIAVSSDGTTAYIIWQDARDYSSTPAVTDTYLAVVKSSGITEMKLRSDTCSLAACLGGYDPIISTDKLGQPIVSWNEFTSDTWPLPSQQKSATPTILLKTHLAVLNPEDNRSEYTLLATTDSFDPNESIFFSRNSVVADYANNYHVFYRDQQALHYVMMKTSSGQTTTPIVPTTEAIGNNGYTSAAADRSGRTYLVWQAGTPFDSPALITIGTSSQLLE